jgi:hypothetical protein
MVAKKKSSDVYVTMTDKALSGWGKSKGKTNKLVFVCKDMEEAMIVAQNAENRSDMKYVNIVSNFPYYNKDRYLTQVKFKADYPTWYRKGAF